MLLLVGKGAEAPDSLSACFAVSFSLLAVPKIQKKPDSLLRSYVDPYLQCFVAEDFLLQCLSS